MNTLIGSLLARWRDGVILRIDFSKGNMSRQSSGLSCNSDRAALAARKISQPNRSTAPLLQWQYWSFTRFVIRRDFVIRGIV